jgi:mxaC protein
MRERITRALKKNRVAVYWIFIRSALSPGLDADDSDSNIPEAALHRFLKTTGVPYQAFEAEDPEAVEQAVAEVDRQQNLPLDYLERIPRRDYSAWCYVLALLAGALALTCRLLTRPAWKQVLPS